MQLLVLNMSLRVPYLCWLWWWGTSNAVYRHLNCSVKILRRDVHPTLRVLAWSWLGGNQIK